MDWPTIESVLVLGAVSLLKFGIGSGEIYLKRAFIDVSTSFLFDCFHRLVAALYPYISVLCIFTGTKYLS